jgi:cysteine sulfinate desulfinase/cysteine desulfurase-like protein
MGLTPAEAHCSVRFSLGAWNTEEEIKYVIEAFAKVLRETHSTVRFVPCR